MYDLLQHVDADKIEVQFSLSAGMLQHLVSRLRLKSQAMQ